MLLDVRLKGFGARATVDEALALINARVFPLASERVPFRTALGRFLAVPVVAERDVPAHPKAAMDGYAVRVESLPGKLPVIGTLRAHERWPNPLKGSETIRIMTGAVVPEGADAVVMFEQTETNDDRVVFKSKPKLQENIIATGEDVKAGRTILHAGRCIGPEDVALLVSVGVMEVDVRRRPRVRIVPTGNELIRAGQRAAAHDVVESNSYMLEGLALRDGGEPIIYPVVRDDRAALRQAIEAPGADVVVLTGGSSVGEEDLAPLALKDVGELVIHGISVRPASPTGIGFVQDKAVVLAPGYPVASYVAWDLFVRPIVQRLLGAPVKLPYRTMRAQLARSFEKPAGRVDVARVSIALTSEGAALASIIPGGASILSSLSRADGFVLFPSNVTAVASGESVDVYLYRQTAAF